MDGLLKNGAAIIVENWIASGVKFIAACGRFYFTFLIMPARADKDSESSSTVSK
jgi:hypothetical protein